MSMRDYGMDDYGIVLNGLGSKKGKHPDFDEAWLDEMQESTPVESQSSFTGEVIPLLDNGSPDWNSTEYFTDETIYYISVVKHPTLFKQAYQDMKEIVDELVSSYRNARKTDDRLPKLTRKEIRGMIRYITGCYCG